MSFLGKRAKNCIMTLPLLVTNLALNKTGAPPLDIPPPLISFLAYATALTVLSTSFWVNAKVLLGSGAFYACSQVYY